MDVPFQLNEGARREDVLLFTEGILEGESNRIANLANLAALLKEFLPRINWCGFYLREAPSGDFVLGPFAGKPACTRIAYGRGVVGAAAAQAQTLLVADVLTFSGHIACDPASRSEMAVPVRSGSRVVAVLDVDSPEVNRFGSADRELLEEMADRLGRSWPRMTGYAHAGTCLAKDG
ncbi:MAG: GAF domain-containing protein [Thermaerobacter sp.]|nr:GAF domain-containing protein [Thermaerobacter sp.]